MRWWDIPRMADCFPRGPVPCAEARRQGAVSTVTNLKPFAICIARDLLADLKAGKLEAVGIDQIRSACAQSGLKDQAALVKLTTRCLVEMASYYDNATLQ